MHCETCGGSGSVRVEHEWFPATEDCSACHGSGEAGRLYVRITATRIPDGEISTVLVPIQRLSVLALMGGGDEGARRENLERAALAYADGWLDEIDNYEIAATEVIQ